MTNLLTRHHFLGGVLLIAGTSIGVGMLALPVVTVEGGFVPALFVYIVCWLFMVAFARLILEACTWMPKDANLITISRNLLGAKGAAACWILYLFLFYCLLTAHIAAGGNAVLELSNHSLSNWLSILIYVFAFAPVVYLGTRAVDRLNTFLMAGVALTYILFIFTAAPHIDFQLLKHHDIVKIWPALSVILTAFGFQNLVPTIYSYMERDHKMVRKAIWIGTSIPLVLYVIWELLVIGIVPLDELNAARIAGQSAIEPLQTALQSNALGKIAQGFAFFAMTTSFVGIAIAFFDFWADGLKWKKTGPKHLILVSLVFAIPLILVFVDPTIFITALTYAGGIGMILLFGLLPVLFVWSGRYFHKHGLSHQFVPGGKFALVGLFLFSVLILLNQLL
jgi:tyrosine-specific transport protein